MIKSYEQAEHVVQSLYLPTLEDAEDYARAILESVEIIRAQKRPDDLPCVQCGIVGGHKMSCTEPGAPRKGRK